MNLKKLFPMSYEKSTLISIIIYLVTAVVASLLIGFAGALTGWIPVVGTLVGWALRIVGIVVDIYVVGGIVVSILLALKVIK
jgi:ABC-type multidrug transport system permease subunit